MCIHKFLIDSFILAKEKKLFVVLYARAKKHP